MESDAQTKGSLLTLIIEKETTVNEILREYNLESKGLIIVVNGNINHDLDTKIKTDDKILILPKVEGG